MCDSIKKYAMEKERKGELKGEVKTLIKLLTKKLHNLTNK